MKGFTSEWLAEHEAKQATKKKQKPVAKKPRSTEHKEQVKLFKWARENAQYFPQLSALFATPNAGRRSDAEGKRMKDEGLRPGVPDVCLPVPNKNHSALFIEMKYGKNKPTESQQHWLHMLETWGNKAVICYTFEEARDTILNYLKLAA